MSMEKVKVKLQDSCLPKCEPDANIYHHRNDGAIRPRNYVHDNRRISSTVGYVLVGLIPPDVIERGMRSVNVVYF